MSGRVRFAVQAVIVTKKKKGGHGQRAIGGRGNCRKTVGFDECPCRPAPSVTSRRKTKAKTRCKWQSQVYTYSVCVCVCVESFETQLTVGFGYDGVRARLQGMYGI